MFVFRWILGPILRAASNGGMMFGLGFAIGKLPVALIMGGIGLGLGVMHGICLAIADSYDWRSGLSWFKFILDNTWSVFNSFAGSVYELILLIMFNPINRDTSRASGAVFHNRPLIPGYDATTVGNVVAGASAGVKNHELIHVLQGRIFGTLYIPLVIANYIIGTILPYWLIYHDRTTYPVRNFGEYFTVGVYRNTWNELWAYKADRS